MNWTDDKHTPAFKIKREGWRQWHRDNPHVMIRFTKLADEARIQRPGVRVGHWLIIGKLRWEHFFETTGPDFKLSNDHAAFYARAYMASHPSRHGFFRIKPMIGEDIDHTRKVCGIKN